jgi:hypothetical protein
LKETVDRLTVLDEKQNPWNSAPASRSSPASSPRRRMSSSVTESPSHSAFHRSAPVDSPPPVDTGLTNALLFSHMASSSPGPSPAPAPDECRVSSYSAPSPSPAPSYDVGDSGGSSDGGGCSGSFD